MRVREAKNVVYCLTCFFCVFGRERISVSTSLEGGDVAFLRVVGETLEYISPKKFR